MLVLSRRPGQGLRIGPNVELQVVRIEGDRVVLGIAAPREIAVVRSELAAEIGDEVRVAAGGAATVRALLRPPA